MHESFLIYRRFRYLKLALLLVVLSGLTYLFHRPLYPPNGGTWLGYTLGTIGALLIVWLTGFGIRKRTYFSRAGMVSGWLSAHVYLGLALLVVATLHTGFQFGWNVHTLAYGLMVLVILSGAWGAVAYLRYPRLLLENGGGLNTDAMLNEIAELDRECLQIADKIGPQAHQALLRSIERTVIGGGLWAQLTATRGKRLAFKHTEEELDQLRQQLATERTTQLQMSPQTQLQLQTQLLQSGPVPLQTTQLPVAGAPGQAPAPASGTMLFVAGQLATAQGDERVEQVQRLLDALAKKKSLVSWLQQDVQYHALMRSWLLLHVPLTVALLAALTVHIITVFFYW